MKRPFITTVQFIRSFTIPILVILSVTVYVIWPKGPVREIRVSPLSDDIANFRTGISEFEVYCGRFPTTEEGLGALLENTSSGNSGTPLARPLSGCPQAAE